MGSSPEQARGLSGRETAGSPDAPAPPRANRNRLRRWGLPAALAFLALWVIYVAAGNLVLGSDALDDWINRRPEKLSVRWESASTWWFGRVSVRGLTVEGRSGRTGWRAEVDRITLGVDLPALAWRTFHMTSGRGEGVLLHLVRLPAPAAEPGSPPAAPQALSGEAAEAISPRRPKRRPWTLRLEDIRLHQVREFRGGSLRLVGDEGASGETTGGRMGGSVRLVPRGPLEVRGLSIDWPAGSLLDDDGPLVEAVRLRAAADLGPFVPREHRGRAVLEFLTGEVEVAGRVANLDFLDRVLTETPELALEGAGSLAARLWLEKGDLLPGSRLEIAEAALEAGILGFEVAGRGSLEGRVEEREGEAIARLAARLEEVRLQETGVPATGTSMSGITVEMTTTSASLVDGFGDSAVALEIPELPLTDVEALNHFLPANAEVTLHGGNASLSGRLETFSGSARADLELAIDDLDLEIRDRRGRGDLLAEVRFRRTGEAEAGGRIDVAGTRLRVNDLALAAEGGVERPGGLELEVVEGALEASGPGEDGESRSYRFPSEGVRLKGRLTDLGLFGDLLRLDRWLQLEGAALLASELRFDELALAVGSSVELSSEEIGATLAGFRARGAGSITARLLQAGPAPSAAAEMLLHQVEIRREGDETPYLVSPSLTVRAQGSDLSGTRDLAGLRVRAELPRAEMPDLTALNVYLPEDTVALTSGHGLFEGRFEFTGGRGDGTFRLQAPGAEARIGQQTLVTDLDLEISLASSDPAAGVFDVSGTRLNLDDTSVVGRRKTSAEGWWAHLSLPRARVRLSRPLAIDGTAELAMLDTAPIVALLGEQRLLVRWFDRLLTVRDVEGTAELEVGERGVTLDPVEITGDGLEVLARLRLAGEREDALFYIKFRNLSAGVELLGGERELHLRRPRQWYDNHPGLPAGR